MQFNFYIITNNISYYIKIILSKKKEKKFRSNLK